MTHVKHDHQQVQMFLQYFQCCLFHILQSYIPLDMALMSVYQGINHLQRQFWFPIVHVFVEIL